MKTLSYGDEIENAEVGTSNLELLISDDKLSANSVNRILQNLYEDNEYNYTLIQNLIKNIYGREDGVLPNVLEEFKEVRILESGTGKSYFRVPFGGINIMQPHYKDNGLSHGLSYSGEEGTDEKKIVNSEFIDDGFDTYTIFNKPKLGLAKRQIADYINLDIADLDNNIKIYAKKFDNPYQVGNSLIYRVADSSQGRAEIEAFGKDGGRNVLDQSVEDSETPFSNTLDKLKYPFVGYYASITENTIGAIDSEIYKANTESSNFPNLKKDTTWIIVFKEKFNALTDAENYPITISFKEMIKDGNNVSYRDVDSYLPAISTFIDASDSGSEEEQINTIVSDINVSYKDYYYAEKLNVEIGENEAAVSYPALSITSKINYIDLTDKVRITLDGSDPIDDNSGTALDGYYHSSSFIKHFIKTEKAKYQNYYYDSISLLTGIFSKYSSYVVNEGLSKKEFSLEETIEVPQPNNLALGTEYQYYIYLNMDLDEKYDTGAARKNKNVSTSKMFGAVLCNSVGEKFENTDIYKYVIKKDLRSKPIALFKVFVKFRENDSGTTGIEIVRQELLKPLLDPNKINTRGADLNKLTVDTNTEIKNQFYYSDKGINKYTVSNRSDVNVIDKDGNKLEEKAPIDWLATPEMHANANANIESAEETRAIKACVSNNRTNFSNVIDENTKEAINVGVDDVIETFAPYIYNHSQDGYTKEVIANTYGKRIKLLEDRKLRIEQQQDSNSYNDLNLFEITSNGLLFKRHEGAEIINEVPSYKVKNYLELKNVGNNITTSEMKARDTGILLSTDVYKSNETELGENVKPDDKNNYFKLYVNDNKTWIKGVSGKLEIAANKVQNTNADIILENEPIHYYDFEAVYANELPSGGVSGEDNNDKIIVNTINNGKGSKYLRLLGNFVIGNKTNSNESKIVNDTPYVAIFNTDTFLKGKLNVTALNDINNSSNFSSFTIEKDKMFSSNYNDFWLNGNYKAEKGETEGRYSFRIRNNEGFEFKKIKAGSNNNNASSESSTLRLNDNEVMFTYKDTSVSSGKNHYFRLWKNNAQLYLTDKFINDFSVFTDDDGRKYNRVTFSIDSGKTGGALILQRKEKNDLDDTKMLANFDTSVIDSNSVYIGGIPYNYQDEDFENKYSKKDGDLYVSGKTTLGIKNVNGTSGETADEKKNVLLVYGKTIIGDDEISSGYNEYGIALDKKGKPLDYKLFVGGITTLRGNLTVTEGTEIHGVLVAESNVTLHDDLEVTEKTTLEKTLNVKAPVYFNCKKNTNGELVVSAGTETVVGKNVYLNDDLVVSNQTTINNKTFIYGITRLNYDKTTGAQTAGTETTVKGKVEIKDTLQVTANVTVGTKDAPRNLDIYGNAIFNKNFDANSSTAKNYITVVDNTVYVKGQLSNLGTTTINGILNIGFSASDAAPTSYYTAINKNQITVRGKDENDETKINGGAITCSYVQTNSSRTKKKNIVHSERDAVKAINNIEIVDFFYKNDKDEKNQKVGFIAEDTDSIFSTNKKDCMDHSNCIGMLLKAIQELSAEIEELKKNR